MTYQPVHQCQKPSLIAPENLNTTPLREFLSRSWRLAFKVMALVAVMVGIILGLILYSDSHAPKASDFYASMELKEYMDRAIGVKLPEKSILVTISSYYRNATGIEFKPMSTLTTNEMELLTNLAQEIGATKYHRRVTVEFDQSRAIQAELEAAIKTNLPGKYVLIDGSHEAKTTSLRLHPLEPLTEEEKNKLTAMAEQIGTTSFHIQVTVDFQ